MKVLMVNGSPHKNGNTATALAEMAKVFQAEGVEVVNLQVGNKDVRGCMACAKCVELGHCIYDDVVNEAADLLAECDGMVVGSPVYFASANGTLISFLDRLFYSANCSKTMKVGASVAVARRGGITSTFDELNKYFTYCGMPVASGQYWNGAHGRTAGEAAQDEEGMQQMRTVAQNMVFLMKAIALGKDAYGLPEQEAAIRTNFIR